MGSSFAAFPDLTFPGEIASELARAVGFGFGLLLEMYENSIAFDQAEVECLGPYLEWEIPESECFVTRLRRSKVRWRGISGRAVLRFGSLEKRSIILEAIYSSLRFIVVMSSL